METQEIIQYLRELANNDAEYIPVDESINTIAADEIDRLLQQVAKAKDIPMKYKRMAFNAELQEENSSLRQRVATLTDQRDMAAEALEAVQHIANNSDGITGWHLNGNIATWDELLPEVSEALAAIQSSEVTK